MSIFGNNTQPHYYAVSSLKLAGSLFVCAFTTISAFLQLVFFILQGIIDWLNQFIMIRIILFPFTYWIRYKYVKDKEGWFVRKWPKKWKTTSCECSLSVNLWQFKYFEVLESILGYDFYYDLDNIQLVIEIRTNARKKIIENVAFKTFTKENNEIIEIDYFTDRVLSKIEHWVRISYIGYSKRKVARKTNSFSKFYLCHDFGSFPNVKPTSSELYFNI